MSSMGQSDMTATLLWAIDRDGTPHINCNAFTCPYEQHAEKVPAVPCIFMLVLVAFLYMVATFGSACCSAVLYL